MGNILHLTVNKNSEQKIVTQIWILLEELKQVAYKNGNQELINEINDFHISANHWKNFNESDFYN